MKFESEYMNYVKKKEEFKLAQMFQFFMIFYGTLLIIISIYYWMITYKIDERMILFSVVGLSLILSGAFWNLSMKKTKDYQKIQQLEQRRFYASILE